MVNRGACDSWATVAVPCLAHQQLYVLRAVAAMKELAPHTTPLLLAAWRLLPAGAAVLAWAAKEGRRNPSQLMGWVAVAVFGLVDGACFQVGYCAVNG